MVNGTFNKNINEIYTYKKAITYINKTLGLVRTLEKFGDRDIYNLERIKSKLKEKFNMIKIKKAKQTTIINFLQTRGG